MRIMCSRGHYLVWLAQLSNDTLALVMVRVIFGVRVTFMTRVRVVLGLGFGLVSC